MDNGLSILQKQFGITSAISTTKGSKQTSAIPIFSFITQLIESLKEYLHSQFRYSWAEFIISNKKPQTYHLVKSWPYHIKHSLQSQLMHSLLLINDVKKCKLFLRLRKYILQLTNITMLDQIVLRHEDVITIVHRMFPANIKREIMNGVKQIFISYKVADAKIYACVFMEYILSVYDSIDEQQQSFLVGDTKISSNIVLSNFSTINKFNSNLHKENGLYRKLDNSDNSYTIIETKFLPQKFEKQKTKFQEQPYGSQYYSNSINFSQENSQVSKNIHHETQKENRSINQNFSIKTNSKNIKIMIDDDPIHEDKPQIKIQDPESSYYLHESKQSSSIKSVCKQMEGLILRNEQFKNRLLSGKTSVKLELSHEQEDSINETINIIHSSIVRNRRDRS